MKTLLLTLLIILVGCGKSGSAGSSSTASSNTPAGNSNQNNPYSYTDNNVRTLSVDVTNGGQSFYGASYTFTDNEVFTIPSVVTLNSNSTGSITNDNYIDLTIANKISCIYNKSGNQFNFDHCTSYATSVYWTLHAGDTYQIIDLNQNSLVADKNKITIFIYSLNNNVRNGHINFSTNL